MQVETYRRSALALLCLSIVAVVVLTGCGGGSSSTTAEGPVADAGQFRSCVERQIGTYPTAPPGVPDPSKAVTAFGVDGSAMGEAGATVSLLHGDPDAYVYETGEEAEAEAVKVRKTRYTPVVDGNVIWTFEGSNLPATWEQILHNCVGESS